MEPDIQENTLPDGGEQAADLARLTAMAGEGQGGPAEVQAEEVAPAIPLSQEIATLLGMLAKMAGPVFPSLPGIYTDETCAAVGAAVEPMCVKHGWLQNGIGGEYKEEIMAAVVLVPLALTTSQAIKADIAARKPAKADPGAVLSASGPALPDAPAPGEPIGQKTVSFGVPDSVEVASAPAKAGKGGRKR